jgi:uncharacterized phosphosugar-binding protein
VALEAKRIGMFVVALTSLSHADASVPRHRSGLRLHDVADLVLDQHAPAGDSAVWIDGLETPVAPISTITSCAIVNAVKSEVASLLTQMGHPPSVLTAACHIGAERAAALFDATYDDYRERVGVLYRRSSGDRPETSRQS